MMRTSLRFTLICSQCGEELECDTESKVTEMKVSFPGRTQAEAVMAIKPCQRCIERIGKPGKLLKEALSLIEAQE